jgi:hypothetical protein
MAVTIDEKIADVNAMEKDSDSNIRVADVVHISATPEQEAKVLAKIDRL